MKGNSSYVPPAYVPLDHSEPEEIVPRINEGDAPVPVPVPVDGPSQWSSTGICAMICRAEAPCGDFVTHFFCHLCAICQEYREIRERSGDFLPQSGMVEITPPPHQEMESTSTK